MKLPSLVTLTLVLVACSLFDGDDLDISVSAPGGVVSPGEALAVEVTAENRGDSRVTWGEGSSTCQLHLEVRLDGHDYLAPAVPRICTADYVEMGLDPGQARTEVLSWAGYVLRDSLELLLPGTYALRGAAGSDWKSPPIEVEIVAE
jgi:hypothetical protein